MVLAPDAKILYVSETINDQLGLNWVSFIGAYELVQREKKLYLTLKMTSIDLGILGRTAWKLSS